MTEDTNLYFEGLKAKGIIFGGWILIFLSLVLLFTVTSLGILFLGGGIAAIIWGKAKRFEFQRKSGHILHKGD